MHRAVDEDDKTGDIVVKVIDNAVSALLKYRNDAAGHAFERAIDALAAACRNGRRIEFYGVGNSGIVAQDAQHKFFRLGVAASAVSDGHVQVMSATMLQPGDCAVIISNSGRSRDLLDAAEIARRKGATTIVITASGSPLAHASQRRAACAARRRPSGRLRPLQPDGVAAAAPDDHRHPDHRRGAAAGRATCGRCWPRSSATCARSATPEPSEPRQRRLEAEQRHRRHTAPTVRPAPAARRARRARARAACARRRASSSTAIAAVSKVRSAAASIMNAPCLDTALRRAPPRSPAHSRVGLRQRQRFGQCKPSAQAFGGSLVALGQLGDQAVDAAAADLLREAATCIAPPATRRAR